jgi:acyl dehydratase
MPVNEDAVGKRWPEAEFEVDADRIKQYAEAVGEENPIYHDSEAAKAAGFRNQVAPPMFCVVYSAEAMAPAILDPDIGINLPMMVHGGQEFAWGEPVCAGDTITTAATCKEIYEKDGKGFYVFESVSTNQQGQQTVKATWTNIVRGV